MNKEQQSINEASMGFSLALIVVDLAKIETLESILERLNDLSQGSFNDIDIRVKIESHLTEARLRVLKQMKQGKFSNDFFKGFDMASKHFEDEYLG